MWRRRVTSPLPHSDPVRPRKWASAGVLPREFEREVKVANRGFFLMLINNDKEVLKQPI